MEGFKKQWLAGIRLLWRLFLLLFFVGGFFKIWNAFILLLGHTIENESFLVLLSGTNLILHIILFPLAVCFVADAVGIKADVFNFELSKRIKEKKN